MTREYAYAARDGNPKRKNRPIYYAPDRDEAARAMFQATPGADEAMTERAFRDAPGAPWQTFGSDIRWIRRSAIPGA